MQEVKTLQENKFQVLWGGSITCLVKNQTEKKPSQNPKPTTKTKGWKTDAQEKTCNQYRYRELWDSIEAEATTNTPLY